MDITSMTNASDTKENTPTGNSILADASTLLMFSNGKKPESKHPSGGPPDTSSTQSEHSKDELQLNRSHASVNPINSTTQVNSNSNTLGKIPTGPSSGLPIETTTKVIEDSQSRESSNSAAVAAAAALATAATIPLPLRKHSSDLSHMDAHDSSTNTGTEPTQHTVNDGDHKKWPVPDSYIVDPDSGIITCVCGFSDDDGFTIQCDHCNRWQHAICYGIEIMNEVPEQYLCNACQPRKIDANAAYLRQKSQRDALQAKLPENTGNVDTTVQQADPTDDSKSNDDVSSSSVQKNKTSKTTNQKTIPTATAASIVPDIRKKEHLLPPKEGFPSVYKSIDANEYDDKYIKLFMDKHNNDDCVITYNHDDFESIPIEVKSYSESNNSRYFPGFMKLGVYIQDDCTKDEFITEVVGHLDFQKNYLNDPRNHYRIWGTPKRKVIFHDHWPLVIDQRSSGNFSRFLRRSCNPNVQLVTLRMPDNSIKFALQALSSIQRGDELYIGWQWDLRHPIVQMINGTSDFESFDDVVKYSLIHSVDTILSNCECGCGNNNKDCHLLRVKKIAQSLVKMVKSKTSNRYKLNQILSNYQLKSKKREQPVLKRLANDANKTSSKNNGSPHDGLLNIVSDEPSKESEHARSEYSKNNGVDVSANTADEKTQKRRHETFVKTLVRNKRAKHLPGKSYKDFEKALHKFDEAGITEVEKLPIPIVMPYANESSTVTDIKHDMDSQRDSDNISRNEHENTNIRDDISSKNGASNNIVPQKGSSMKHDELTSNATNSVNSKKKLSFADYRKKLQK